jgi:hypothetical protein
MTEKQVKDFIGEENWKKFCNWMYGQTIGLNSDGSIDYYNCDVKAFKTLLDKGYDRQSDPFAWD